MFFWFLFDILDQYGPRPAEDLPLRSGILVKTSFYVSSVAEGHGLEHQACLYVELDWFKLTPVVPVL
jgi:hypothetical protein